MAKETYIRLRCTNKFKAQIEALASNENRTTSNYIENLLIEKIKENKTMKNTLEMQYEQNGEWFEIWNTEQTDLELAWKEMDDQPTEGGTIRFKGELEILIVNGGF